jgi:hypothetical protein
MRASEFVLWYQGYLDACGDNPPTTSDMAKVRAELELAVADVVSNRLLNQSEVRRTYPSFDEGALIGSSQKNALAAQAMYNQVHDDSLDAVAAALPPCGR